MSYRSSSTGRGEKLTTASRSTMCAAKTPLLHVYLLDFAIRVLLSPWAWRVLGLRMEERLTIWTVAANILNKQLRATERVRSSASELGEVLTIPHHRNVSCYGIFTQKSSDLNRYFGTTYSYTNGT